LGAQFNITTATRCGIHAQAGSAVGEVDVVLGAQGLGLDTQLHQGALERIHQAAEPLQHRALQLVGGSGVYPRHNGLFHEVGHDLVADAGGRGVFRYPREGFLRQTGFESVIAARGPLSNLIHQPVEHCRGQQALHTQVRPDLVHELGAAHAFLDAAGDQHSLAVAGPPERTHVGQPGNHVTQIAQVGRLVNDDDVAAKGIHPHERLELSLQFLGGVGVFWGSGFAKLSAFLAA